MFVKLGLQLISDISMRIYSKASIAENPFLCLQFNKFSDKKNYRFRKNKGRSKVVKPHGL